jgi:tetratricopeptide (TPR) repeat protein
VSRPRRGGAQAGGAPRAARPRPAQRLAVALALALLLPACGPAYGDAYLGALAAGERAYHAGRYAEAARAFSNAASQAERVKDRDEARLLEARAHQRAGSWSDARATYQRLLTESPPGPRAPRAEFELARIAIEHGDAEAGWALLLEATRRHPTHGLSRNALRELADRELERAGPVGALAWLRRQEPAFRGTELDQVIGYQIGLALQRTGDREGALRELVAAARAHPYPFGALTDNALLRAAKIAEELGRFEEAIGYLRELTTTREGASTGSYERPLFDDAQLAIAAIYRDRIGDRAAARRELRALYTRFPQSLLRDDALWSEAKLWREDKRQEEACDVASKLAREFPDSRYARCVSRLCPSLPAGPRECAGYIVRELEGDDREGPEEQGGEGDRAGSQDPAR